MTDTAANIAAAARDWLARLYAEEDNAETRAAFSRWIAADPAHAEAYRALEQSWRDLPLLDRLDAPAPVEDDRIAAFPVERRERARLGGWRAYAAAGAAALAACLVVLVLGPHTAAPTPTVYASAIGEIEAFVLADGSVLTLGGDTRATVLLGKKAREVRLGRGRALFEVAKDADRPFTVAAGEARVTVTGTVFDVRNGPDDVRVGVAEGAVRVGSEAGEAVALTADQRVRVDADGVVGTPEPFDADAAHAWRTGRLAFVDARLEDIVADVNRYRHTPIRIADAALEDLRFTTAFGVDETDQLLAGLTATGAAEIVRTNAFIILRAPTH